MKLSLMSIGAAMAIAVPVGLVSGMPAASGAQPDPLPLGSADLPSVRSDSESVDQVDQPRSASTAKRHSYLLKLSVRPTLKTYRAAGAGHAGRQAARQQLATVEAAQDRVIADLPVRTRVLYRTHALLSGVAVDTRTDDVADLERIPGVASVHPIAPKKPALSSSIPLQGGPAAWQSAGTGAGTKIAIIDSGVDYTHATFGGAGTEQAFQDAQAINDRSWITSKVVEGYDLVGDDYDAETTNPPVPDPNPLDCGGHGTHVAGIAAGQGVRDDGSAYTGPYDESTDFGAMRIGPGMAPEAELYAYRVFGCEGSSSVVTEAIDMAVDPDRNGDPSDHVDVINMSLGSDFGSSQDADSLASDAAVEAGVVVVVSAGNGSDLTDVSGSPGNATKVLTVANSADGQSIVDAADMDIKGNPARFGVSRSVLYDWRSAPDLAGPVVEAPASNDDACAPFTPDEQSDIVGKVVLVTWTQDALECGSITRGANLRNAGAVGFILANSAQTFSGGINGDGQIPGVLMVKSGADAIRAALRDSDPVSAVGTEANAVVLEHLETVDTINSSSSRGVHGEGNVKPDVAAVGDSVFSAASGTGDQGISESGTSMAAPTVAGLAALVVQQNPTWTPEQVKAAIMNTASADVFTEGPAGGFRYAPVRVGSGRIQAADAVANEVVAAVVDDPGAVSVSFGPVEVSGPTSLTKRVSVTNTSASPVDYQVSFDDITSVAGTSFTVSPSDVAVPAGATREVTVTFNATGRADLDNGVDPTVGRWSSLGLPRTTLAEASGHLLLTPISGTTRRVPVYAAPRPVSTLSGGSRVVLDEQQSGTLTMSGTGLGFGVNGTADEDSTNDLNSIGGAFELSALDPVAPECASVSDVLCYTVPVERSADVRRVGVTTTEDMAYFAIATEKPWSTPAGSTSYEVAIDVDNDAQVDFVAYTTRLGETDTMVVGLYDFALSETIDVQYLNGLPGNIDTSQYDGDVMVLPVSLAALADAGVDANNPRINYGVMTWSYYAAGPIDVVGIDVDDDSVGLTVDLFNPGLRAVDANDQPIYPETAGSSLRVTFDQQSYEANNGQGLMLVHFHNAGGARSEILTLAAATATSLSAGSGSVEVNNAVSLDVAVTGAPGNPSGQVEVVSAQTGAVLATGPLGPDGRASLTYTPTEVGTVRMLARYVGDTEYAPSVSDEAVVEVTPATAVVTSKKKQVLSAKLPKRIKRSGLTVITPANALTNAGQLVRTRIKGSSVVGETRTFSVVRGKKGKVSIRTYGRGKLRFVIVQSARATSTHRPFTRQAVYVGGTRRR